MLHHLRPSLAMLAAMVLLTGVAYPLVLTGFGEAVFPVQARASLIVRDGTIVGSRLVGQAFAASGYFHPRPSAVDYDAAASGASNLAPTNATLLATIGTRAADYAALNGVAAVPADAVTASGSGLDPDISPANARAQVGRVAAARGMETSVVADLVAEQTQGRWLGLFGAERVNVLELNLALDRVAPVGAAVAVQ